MELIFPNYEIDFLGFRFFWKKRKIKFKKQNFKIEFEKNLKNLFKN